MEAVEGRRLFKELTETVLLLAITGFTLAGWVGVALFFVKAAG